MKNLSLKEQDELCYAIISLGKNENLYDDDIIGWPSAKSIDPINNQSVQVGLCDINLDDSLSTEIASTAVSLQWVKMDSPSFAWNKNALCSYEKKMDSLIYYFPQDNNPFTEIVQLNYKKKYIHNLIIQLRKINEIESLGNTWDNDYNTPGPSKKILLKAKEIIYDLLKNDIIPYRIAPISEEGICFFFKSNGKRMYLELYNDGDIGYVIENYKTKEIIENYDILQNEIINKVKNFITL